MVTRSCEYEFICYYFCHTFELVHFESRDKSQDCNQKGRNLVCKLLLEDSGQFCPTFGNISSFQLWLTSWNFHGPYVDR